MKSFRDRNPYIVGFVSVLLLSIATGSAFAVGFLNLLEDAYDAEAIFDDASGLRVGDDIRIAGVKVGRVTKVEADRASGNVRVKFNVNNGVEVHNESGAEIALASLLGAKYIRLNDPLRGPTLLDELPREQRVIPLERTKTPFDLFRLTKVATEGIVELNTDQLNELVSDLADVTEGKQATVQQLSDGIRRVGGAINERDDQLDSLIDQADRLAGTLSDKDDEIVALIDTSEKVLDLVVRRRNELSLLLGESADVVQELSRLIADNKAIIDSALDSLSPTLDVVARQQDDIDRGLAWLGPGFVQQSRGGGQGPWQDVFVRSLGPDAVAVLQDLYRDILGIES